MARTLIHIGMPRTASTFLQQAFFPKVKGFKFYGVETTYYTAAFQKLLYQDDSLFNDTEFEKTASEIRSKDAILSNELFVGQSLYLNSTNRSRTARRLKHFFPDAEIVILLRNQVSLLQSLYAIGVYSGHTATPETFIRFSNTDSTVQKPLYPTFAESETTEGYFYTHLVSLYQGLFKNVNVLLFEDFKANPAAFAERISTQLNFEKVELSNQNRPVNKSLSARQIKMVRKLNHYKTFLNRGRFGQWLFAYKLRFIEHRIGGSKQFEFSGGLQSKLRVTFYDDNKKLGEMMPELSANEVFFENYLGEYR